MNLRLGIHFLTPLCLLPILCCSYKGPLSYPEAVDTESALCPLKISTVGNRFKSAGQVKYVFTPDELKEIYVFEPFAESFEALRVNLSEKESIKRKKSGMLGDYFEGREFRTYPLSRGVPSVVWHSVRNIIQKGEFEVLPGEYRVMIRYSLDMSKQPGYFCFAETDTFIVEERSYWISTEG